MRWSTPRLFVALLAAPVLFVSSSALAGPTGGPQTCLLATAKSCDYVVSSGGCEAQCTPGSFVAECDGSCNVSADVKCTDTCVASCKTSCMVNPPMFSCTDDCTGTCKGQCMTTCTDPGCESDCELDCGNRCDVQCSATTGSVDCDTECQASCNASCQVQINASCHVNCTSMLELPVCQANCSLPQGALFCDGQYVDIATAGQDCIAYLESQGVTVNESCTASAGSGSSCTASVGCSASPTALAPRDRWGVLGITGLLAGLGLVVSRRRRRA